MNTYPSVISLGEALWDVFACERRLGGAPANFACHVAQQGVSACAVSAIGMDAAGDALEAALAAAAVPCILQRVPYATGEVHIVLEGDGMPRYDIRANAAWDHLRATPELLDMARHAQAICFGTLAQRSEESRAAIAALVQAMPPECWRILDINLRCGLYTPTLLQDSLSLANVLKINDEEMETLARIEGFSGLPQLEQARGIAERYGLNLLILTCGALGSYVLGEGGQLISYLVTPKVHVCDTVGAGDSFTAAFISGLLRGLTVPEAHAAAVRVAAWVCTQPGAMPELPPSLRFA